MVCVKCLCFLQILLCAASRCAGRCPSRLGNQHVQHPNISEPKRWEGGLLLHSTRRVTGGSPSPTRKLGAPLSPGAGATIKSTGEQLPPVNRQPPGARPSPPKQECFHFLQRDWGWEKEKSTVVKTCFPTPRAACAWLEGALPAFLPGFPGWVPESLLLTELDMSKGTDRP